LAHAGGVLYGTELGSVTLKRVVLFCFSTKSSTHSPRGLGGSPSRRRSSHKKWCSRHYNSGLGVGDIIHIHSISNGGRKMWGWEGDVVRGALCACASRGIGACLRLCLCLCLSVSVSVSVSVIGLCVFLCLSCLCLCLCLCLCARVGYSTAKCLAFPCPWRLSTVVSSCCWVR
jgi:hypothetical protein